MMISTGNSSTKGKLLTPSTIEEIKALPGVEKIILQDNLKGNFTLEYGRLMTYGNVMGVSTRDLADYDYPLMKGGTKLEQGTAVIGGWMAKNFVNPNQRPGQLPPPQPDLVNQQVRLVLTKTSSEGKDVRKVVNLRIVGVLAESRSMADSSLYVRLEDATVWNEWFTGKRISRYKDGYDSIIVTGSDVKQISDLVESINQLGLMAYSPQQMVQEINSLFVVLQIFFGAIGAVSLLVAAIGIANTMTMSILERTAEIGLIKAIGASNSDVMGIFLGEASGIGFLGGLIGVALGWGGGVILNMVALVYFANRALKGGGAPPAVVVYTPLWLPLAVLVLATVVGMASGYFPAKRAMNLPPVQALKHE